MIDGSYFISVPYHNRGFIYIIYLANNVGVSNGKYHIFPEYTDTFPKIWTSQFCFPSRNQAFIILIIM